MALDGVALTTVNKTRLLLRRQGITDPVEQELLEDLISGYSVAAGKYCHREFSRPAETDIDVARTFDYAGTRLLSLSPYDLRSVTAIVLDGTALTVASRKPGAGEYRLMPRQKTPEGTYWWIELGSCKSEVDLVVTGRWGLDVWAAAGPVPADLGLAVRIAVANNFRNPEGAAVRTFGELTLSEVAEDAEAPGRSLPPDARGLLKPFMRGGIGA